VLIYDIRDSQLVADMRQAVFDAFDDCGASDPATVCITAARLSGRWDVEVRAERQRQRHCFSFAASPPLLPEFVRHCLTLHWSRESDHRRHAV
jgi:hypothetical protein